MASGSRSSDYQRQLAAQRAAARQAAREADLLRKAEIKKYEEGRVAEAAAKTSEVERRMQELGDLLTAALSSPPRPIDLPALKRQPPTLPLDLGVDAQPIRPPVWQEPRPPSAVGRFFGGEARHARAKEEAERAYAVAVERYKAYEVARQRRVAQIRRDHAERQAAATAEAAKYNARIDAWAEGVRNGDRHAVSRYFQKVIENIRDPKGFPKKRLAGYVPESTLLALEWRLPTTEVVPADRSFKWVKARDEITSAGRSANEVRLTYQRLVSEVALRALHAVFTVDRHKLVSTVVFNGIVDAIDPATGQNVEPCLITLRATREQFAPLVLAKVDPVACIRKHFAADVSPHPEELQPVAPVMEFKMADPRIIDPVDVISQLDKRPNLMELTPKEFEHFIHNLFTRMKFDTKIFKADGDGGVDCVAYDPTPIRGGKYVIQAKHYRKTVPPTAVRDLYGTMQHEGATSGILITTSGYGPSSYEFASGKPLQLIDGSGLLAICKEYGIPARIVPVAKK